MMITMSGWIGRILKEVLFICAVSIIAITIIRFVLPRLSQSGQVAYIAEVKRIIGNRAVIAYGKRLTVRNTNLDQHPYTFLLFTSPACGYCTSSAKFHHSILLEAKRRSVPFYVVLPKASRAGQYLSSSGLSEAEVRDFEDVSLRAHGTPCVVLVNADGVVRGTWLGELAVHQQAEVLAAIRRPDQVATHVRRLEGGEPMISLADLRRLSVGRAVTLISTVERGEFAREHLDHAVNIPFDELTVRAPIELRRTHLLVVDCSSLSDETCSMGVRSLTNLDFQVLALDAGLKSDPS